MKTVLSCVLLMIAFTVNAQTSIKDLSKKKVAWMGVDFSLGKFVGKDGFSDLQKIKDHYFSEWNNLTMNEQKQNLIDMMDLDDLQFFVDPAMKNNNGIKIIEYVQDDPHRISEDDVKAAVGAYDLSKSDAEVGVTFFVEFFSKSLESGSIYATWFDVSSKEVFFIKRITTSPKGFGFRNYWMGCIKGAIAEVNGKWKKWKKGKE